MAEAKAVKPEVKDTEDIKAGETEATSEENKEKSDDEQQENKKDDSEVTGENAAEGEEKEAKEITGEDSKYHSCFNKVKRLLNCLKPQPGQFPFLCVPLERSG